VSYYAVFKEWLLPSQPSKIQNFKPPFSLRLILRNLIRLLGLFPSWPWTFSPIVCLLLVNWDIQSFNKNSQQSVPLYLSSALPSQLILKKRSAKTDFAENQLFPCLIGLSPLIIIHPILLQQKQVRSSKILSTFFQSDHD